MRHLFEPSFIELHQVFMSWSFISVMICVSDETCSSVILVEGVQG